MKRVMILIVAVITACAIFIGCNNAKPNGVSLHETPQIYILQGEDSSTTMPTVTLYENGNACLSQPPISSYAIFKIGKYEIDGNKLTVKHNDSSSATFEISDGGDTLTLLSTNLGFTKIGAVYKYRSNTDYLSGLMRVDGEKLTLDTLFPVEAGKDTARTIPNAKLLLIEGMGHDMPKGTWKSIVEAIAIQVNDTTSRSKHGEVVL